MTYNGHVENGLVVFDEPTRLSDGTRVQIEVLQSGPEKVSEDVPSLAERLAPFIGKAVGLPEDAAENHDHYLYGTPKR